MSLITVMTSQTSSNNPKRGSSPTKSKGKIPPSNSHDNYCCGHEEKEEGRMNGVGDVQSRSRECSPRILMDTDEELGRGGGGRINGGIIPPVDRVDVKGGGGGGGVDGGMRGYEVGGGVGGGGGGREEMCCTDGRVWIFLVLGVLTIVFSAVLVGVYFNVRSLTSSLDEMEVLPSYIPAVAGGVAGLFVLLLFWRRRKHLVYLVLFLCFITAVLCVILGVLTGTRVLQPLLTASNCVYTRRARTCQCVVDDGTESKGSGSGSRTQTKDSSLLIVKDVAGCRVVEDILPNMLFTMVGIFGVIALVCCINGVIAILVCRMEYNRKKMQKLQYSDDTPSSSNSDCLLLEQQTMLPSSISSANLQQQQQQQQLRQQQQQNQLLQQQQQQQLQFQNHHQLQQQLASPPSSSLPSPAISTTTSPTSTILKPFNPSNAILADIYTNANAIEDLSENYNENDRDEDDEDEEEEEEGETTSSDAIYSPSDVPIGYAEACRMRRSKSFSHPINRGRSRSPNSTASTSTPPPFSPNMATANSIGNFLTATSLSAADNNNDGGGGGRLAPHRRRNRRAVTLHGLDRDQLMLILNLQMRYLQESDHDSKKPENFALNLTSNSTTDIQLKTEEKMAENEERAKQAVGGGAVIQQEMTSPQMMSKSYHDVHQLKDRPANDMVVNGVLNQVISSNLSGIKGKSRSMKCVGPFGGSEQFQGQQHHPHHTIQNPNSFPDNNNAQFHNDMDNIIGQTGYPPFLENSCNYTNNPIPFSQLQKRSMTPTPRQERLSSTRTSDDDWDFKPAKIVRSHTPQPHHFKNNHGFFSGNADNDYNDPYSPQQYFYNDPHHQQQQYQQQHPQQQQYDFQQYLKQQEQYRTLQQLQQRQLQELQRQNVQQQQQIQEKLFLEQQAAMISQQQNIIQQQQRREEMQRQQELLHHQQLQQQQQQTVNERYQQIVQEQLIKESNMTSSAYLDPLTSSSLSTTAQTIDDDDDEDDDEPTLITIDLRDVTKTGPLVYENVPPPRKLSHQSGMTNSTSSLASSCFHGYSAASPQPKSILHNRMLSSNPNAQNPYTNPYGQMVRQLSQSSNLSSCSGSIAMEIQKALEGSTGNTHNNPNIPPPSTTTQPTFPVDDIPEEPTETINTVKDAPITPGKIIKPKKKLSKKEKKELKEKEKEIKELEKEKQKEKEKTLLALETCNDPAKSSGLARSDSDNRKSGIPDRWQTIMTNAGGTENTPQTLWENVQKKVAPETDPSSTSEPGQQAAATAGGPPYSRQQSKDSCSGGGGVPVMPSTVLLNQQGNHAPMQSSGAYPPVPTTQNTVNHVEKNRKTTATKPGCLKNGGSSVSNNYNTTPNIIFPLTYDTTRAPQPYNPQQPNNNIMTNPLDQMRQPPVGVADVSAVTSPSLSRPLNQQQHQQQHPQQRLPHQPTPLPNHHSNNSNAFVPITPGSSRLPINKSLGDNPPIPAAPMFNTSPSKHNPNTTNNSNNMPSDPTAPPKPPRLHDRKQQQQGTSKNPQTNLRPKSYVNAVGNSTSSNNNKNINTAGTDNIIPDNHIDNTNPQSIYGNVVANSPQIRSAQNPSTTTKPQPPQTPPKIAIPASRKQPIPLPLPQHSPKPRGPPQSATSRLFPAGKAAATSPQHSQIPINVGPNPNQNGAYTGSPASPRVPSSQVRQQPIGSTNTTPPLPQPPTNVGGGGPPAVFPKGQGQPGILRNQMTSNPGQQGPPRQQLTPNRVANLAACDTDLDDLPTPQHATPLRCQSLSPPPYAPPPLYKSMESVANRERSTSSSSSEPHNTSCSLSESHNASFASSERSYTPPVIATQQQQQQQHRQQHQQRDAGVGASQFQQRRGRDGQHSLSSSLRLPNDRDHPSNQWRRGQGQGQGQLPPPVGQSAQGQGRHPHPHTMGRQLSAGDATTGYLPSSSRQQQQLQQLSPSHFVPPPPLSSSSSSSPSPSSPFTSPQQRGFQNGTHNSNHHHNSRNDNQNNLLDNSTSSSVSSSSSSTSPSMLTPPTPPTPPSHNNHPHYHQQQPHHQIHQQPLHQHNHQQLLQQQQQQQQQEPYMLMRRCQSVEDGGGAHPGLQRSGWSNSSAGYGNKSWQHNNSNNPNNPPPQQHLLPSTIPANTTNTTNNPNHFNSNNDSSSINSNNKNHNINAIDKNNKNKINSNKIFKSPNLQPTTINPPSSNNHANNFTDRAGPQQTQTQITGGGYPPRLNYNNEPVFEGRQMEFPTNGYSGSNNINSNPPLHSMPMHEGENPDYAETTI